MLCLIRPSFAAEPEAFPNLGPLPAAPTYDAAPELPATARKPRTGWYGWQILAFDVAVLAVATDRLRDRTGERDPSAALTAYAFGSPLLHALNGRPGRGAWTFAVRVPVIGVGALSYLGCAWEKDPHRCAGALVIPLLAFSIIDGAALAKHPPPETTAASGKLRPSWSPTVAPTMGGRGAMLGAVGTF